MTSPGFRVFSAPQSEAKHKKFPIKKRKRNPVHPYPPPKKKRKIAEMKRLKLNSTSHGKAEQAGSYENAESQGQSQLKPSI